MVQSIPCSFPIFVRIYDRTLIFWWERQCKTATNESQVLEVRKQFPPSSSYLVSCRAGQLANFFDLGIRNSSAILIRKYAVGDQGAQILPPDLSRSLGTYPPTPPLDPTATLTQTLYPTQGRGGMSPETWIVLKFPTGVTARNFKHGAQVWVESSWTRMQKQIEKGSVFLRRTTKYTNKQHWTPGFRAFRTTDYKTRDTRNHCTANRSCCSHELHLSDSVNPIIRRSPWMGLSRHLAVNTT